MINQCVSLLGPSGKKSQCTLDIHPLSVSHRLFKTVLKSALLIICAALSVIVPLLHFILPFLFLGLAIYVGISTFRQKDLIDSGHGKCPECGADFRIMRRTYKFPFHDVCEGCKRQIQVTAQ